MGFIGNTRQNFTNVAAQPLVRANRHIFVLPKVGFLSRLYLTLTAVVAVDAGTGTVALSERTAYNLIKRIRVIANTGASIFDVSGYGTYLINRMIRKDSAVFDSALDAGTKSLVYAAPLEDKASNAWKLCLEIPIAINDRDPIGLIMMQSNATQITVEVDLNEEAGTDARLSPILLTGNATAAISSGTVGLAMEYFTLPLLKEDYPAINIVHQWIEQQNALTAAGKFVLPLLRGNTYTRLAHIVTIGGALNSAAVDQLAINYNQAEKPYILPRLVQLFLQRERYGFDLPKGTFVHDWSTTGNGRDFINSANVTEFQSEIEIASGTTVAAGTSHINTLSEQLIRIA